MNITLKDVARHGTVPIAIAGEFDEASGRRSALESVAAGRAGTRFVGDVGVVRGFVRHEWSAARAGARAWPRLDDIPLSRRVFLSLAAMRMDIGEPGNTSDSS